MSTGSIEHQSNTQLFDHELENYSHRGSMILLEETEGRLKRADKLLNEKRGEKTKAAIKGEKVKAILLHDKAQSDNPIDMKIQRAQKVIDSSNAGKRGSHNERVGLKFSLFTPKLNEEEKSLNKKLERIENALEHSLATDKNNSTRITVLGGVLGAPQEEFKLATVKNELVDEKLKRAESYISGNKGEKKERQRRNLKEDLLIDSHVDSPLDKKLHRAEIILNVTNSKNKSQPPKHNLKTAVLENYPTEPEPQQNELVNEKLGRVDHILSSSKNAPSSHRIKKYLKGNMLALNDVPTDMPLQTEKRLNRAENIIAGKLPAAKNEANKMKGKGTKSKQ
jgi:hypothetical protein